MAFGPRLASLVPKVYRLSLSGMLVRLGHRARWTAIWVLVAAWFLALVVGTGGGLPNLLLVLAIVVLFYELLAADPGSR